MGYRFRRYYDNFRAGDPVIQFAALIALVLLVMVILPLIPLPWSAAGGNCTQLANSRLSPNNQSVLSGQAGSEALRLEIAPNEITLPAGQALNFDVRFVNDSMAPLNLFFTQDRFIFRYREEEDGLLLLLRPVNGPVLGEPLNVRPLSVAPEVFDPSQVFVLSARRRCSLPVSISPQRLQAARVGVGTYSVIAVYRNRQRGKLPPPAPLTPTPVFKDQGVWVGQVRSQEVRININPAQ
jgi:hypothetical protein